MVGAEPFGEGEGAAAMSTTATSEAPASLAHSMVSRPIGPAPNRIARRPSISPARATACRQTASGSARAAAAKDSSFGTLTHWAAVASNRLAKPPCMCGVLDAEPMK